MGFRSLEWMTIHDRPEAALRAKPVCLGPFLPLVDRTLLLRVTVRLCTLLRFITSTVPLPVRFALE